MVTQPNCLADFLGIGSYGGKKIGKERSQMTWDLELRITTTFSNGRYAKQREDAQG